MKFLCFSILLTALLCGLDMLGGCTSQSVKPKLPNDSIAVVPARYLPKANFNVYALGKSAAASRLGLAGAGVGAVYGAAVPLEMGTVGIVVYPIIAPFTILGGVIIGGGAGISSGVIHGLSDDEVDNVSVLVDQAIYQLGVHEQLSKRVITRAQKAGIKADLLLEVGPTSPEEEKHYSTLSATYGAVLELTVDKVGMSAHKGEPPRVALEMKMHARVVCFGEGGVSGGQPLEWAGRPRSISEWEKGGADLLAADFEEGYETLAQYVWEIIFPDVREISRSSYND